MKNINKFVLEHLIFSSRVDEIKGLKELCDSSSSRIFEFLEILFENKGFELKEIIDLANEIINERKIKNGL